MTSGSTDFTLVTNQIIEEAFDLCGIGSEGEAISADQYARAKRSLNLIVKHKGMKGHLWVREDKTVTLVASQAGYALTPKPLRVMEVRRKVTSSGIETPLSEWARGQYKDQPNKATESIPVAYYYDPQLSTGTLYLWPTPSSATASAMTVELTVHRVMDDFDGSADAPDLPQEQLRSLVYDLAEELALKYAIRADLRQEIAARAALYRAEAESWDTEPASLYLQPDHH
ncbi:hypothetical protein [Novosphingobium sp. KN65.2]|uniref:phage adaptor protein n=1 Tax=Novosphingobium sp. KN65.2 TaxID=1478134 RepID=UPI0005DEEB6F|nr:hypothetical protein [Novosphingobium sp. KN65.2]CDO34431.1 hypothetical protein SPHV1_1570004 [Novosphingobium sp. KN65.2]